MTGWHSGPPAGDRAAPTHIDAEHDFDAQRVVDESMDGARDESNDHDRNGVSPAPLDVPLEVPVADLIDQIREAPVPDDR